MTNPFGRLQIWSLHALGRLEVVLLHFLLLANPLRRCHDKASPDDAPSLLSFWYWRMRSSSISHGFAPRCTYDSARSLRHHSSVGPYPNWSQGTVLFVHWVARSVIAPCVPCFHSRKRPSLQRTSRRLHFARPLSNFFSSVWPPSAPRCAVEALRFGATSLLESKTRLTRSTFLEPPCVLRAPQMLDATRCTCLRPAMIPTKRWYTVGGAGGGFSDSSGSDIWRSFGTQALFVLETLLFSASPCIHFFGVMVA